MSTSKLCCAGANDMDSLAGFDPLQATQFDDAASALAMLKEIESGLLRYVLPLILVSQFLWMCTWPLLGYFHSHYEHGHRLVDSFVKQLSPMGHCRFVYAGGWRFILLYLLGWSLIVWSIAGAYISLTELEMIVSGTVCALGQVLMSSSFLVYDTGFAGAPRTNTWVFHAFVAMTLHLVILGAALSILAGLGVDEVDRDLDSDPLWSPSGWAFACMAAGLCLLHGLGGRWHNGAGAYKFFQPGKGGSRYVWSQAVAWSAFAACIVLLLITLLCKVGTCLPLPIFLQHHQLGISAGASGVVAELAMVLSIVVFEQPGSQAGVPSFSPSSSPALSPALHPPPVPPERGLWAAVQSLHDRIYPQDSTYYWYRTSRFKKDVGGNVTLRSKYWRALALVLIAAVCGSGVMPWLVWYMLYTTGYREVIAAAPIDDVACFCVPTCLAAGVATATAYHFGASRLQNEYDVLLADSPADWKVQPDRVLSPALKREALIAAMVNCMLAGSIGMGIFLRHLNTGNTLSMYMDISEHSWAHFFGGVVFVFFWIDIWAYFAHRFLHMKGIYKYFHKWHHRYQPPTAVTAFAMHPCEFVLFQLGGISCCFFFEIHILAFMFNAVAVAYHGQIDHSGIDFEGELPWQPSVHFHDDHHRYFHLNFGQNLILWDYLFGTLRQENRKYGEDVFVGLDQKQSAAEALSPARATCQG